MGYGVNAYAVDFQRLRKRVGKRPVSAARLERLCDEFGQRLSNNGWSAIGVRWFTTVDAAARQAKLPELYDSLFSRGSPVKLSAIPDDFPLIGHLEPNDVSKLRRALAKFETKRSQKTAVLPDGLRPMLYTMSIPGKQYFYTIMWEDLRLVERIGFRKTFEKEYKSARDAATELEKRLSRRGKQGCVLTPRTLALLTKKPLKATRPSAAVRDAITQVFEWLKRCESEELGLVTFYS